MCYTDEMVWLSISLLNLLLLHKFVQLFEDKNIIKLRKLIFCIVVIKFKTKSPF